MTVLPPGRGLGSDFDAWLRWVFAGPWIGERGDLGARLWPEEPADEYPADPSACVASLTRLFERSEEHLAQYAPRAVGLGLRFLVDPSLSSHMFALVEPTVSVDERVRCVRSMNSLFKDTFAKRCEPMMFGQLSPGSDIYELNASCFDFWYLAPIFVADVNEIGMESMRVMSEVGRLENPACVESALRGLGWNRRLYPEMATSGIESILARRDAAFVPRLRDYAQVALRGRVA